MKALFLLLIFLFFAAAMLRGKVPALLAIPGMAILMAFVAGADAQSVLSEVVVAGSVQLSTAYMAVFFGAVLGQVAVLTGIAERIIKLAAEFGGDRPLLIAFSMTAVTGLLFVSLTGLGAIMMVGGLVLPIMMSAGVPPRLAGAAFLMGYGTGYVVNLSLWQFYRDVLNIPISEVGPFALKILLINAVITVFFLLYYSRKMLVFATWTEPATAAEGEADLHPDELKRSPVPALSLATPLVPLILHLFLGWQVIPSFLGGALFGVLATRRRDAIKILSRSAISGMEAAAPAIVLMVGIGMLLKMSFLPEVRLVLEPFLGYLSGLGPWSYVATFTLLAPFVLYRGPLNPWGLGIGVYALLNSTGTLPSLALLAALISLTQVQGVCDPTNTHNVWVANYAGVSVDKITRMTLLFQIAVAFLGLCLGAWLYF